MAIIKLNKHVLNDPSTMTAIREIFPKMEDITPYAGDEPIYKLYRVLNETQNIPADDTFIELTIQLVLGKPTVTGWYLTV